MNMEGMNNSDNSMDMSNPDDSSSTPPEAERALRNWMFSSKPGRSVRIQYRTGQLDEGSVVLSIVTPK